jgi:hypothetical protein
MQKEQERVSSKYLLDVEDSNTRPHLRKHRGCRKHPVIGILKSEKPGSEHTPAASSSPAHPRQQPPKPTSSQEQRKAAQQEMPSRQAPASRRQQPATARSTPAPSTAQAPAAASGNRCPCCSFPSDRQTPRKPAPSRRSALARQPAAQSPAPPRIEARVSFASFRLQAHARPRAVRSITPQTCFSIRSI